MYHYHDDTVFEDSEISDESIMIAFEEAATVSEGDIAPTPAKEVHERKIENFSATKQPATTENVPPH